MLEQMIGPIDRNGNCSTVKLVRGHPLFVKASTDNARQWTFVRAKGSSGHENTFDIIYRFIVEDKGAPGKIMTYFRNPNLVTVVATVSCLFEWAFWQRSTR